MTPAMTMKLIDGIKDKLQPMSRSEVSDLVNETSRKRIRCSLTLYFDESGDIHPELDLNLKNDALLKLFGSGNINKS